MGPVAAPKKQDASPVSVERAVSRETARILVIDDEPACRRMTQRMLETLGFSPITAATGREGVEKARDFLPDMILLDLHLPGMNGFEVLRILRAAAQTRHIPVLCVTGKADPAGLLRDASLGMAAFGHLRKPFTREELRTEIERGLAAAREASPAEPGRMLRRGSLLADHLEREAWIGNRQVKLDGKRQFPLLWELMRRSSPVSFEEILCTVWKDGDGDLAKVHMAVMRLRRALEAAEALCRIETVGHGYQLVLSEDA